MTALNGEVFWSAKYESFGKVDIEIQTVENNLRFPGQYYDRKTDIEYNRFRYYDQEEGRYLRTDPIRLVWRTITFNIIDNLSLFPHSIDEDKIRIMLFHSYAYTNNNPINYIDPLGLDRYNPCKRFSGLFSWACRKYVDWGCKGERNTVCCEEERKECLSKIDYCSNEAEQKLRECNAEYLKCNLKTKK